MKKNIYLFSLASIMLFCQSACSVYPQSNSLFGKIWLADHYHLVRQRNIVLPFQSAIYLPLVKQAASDQRATAVQLHSLVDRAAMAFMSRFQKVAIGHAQENIGAAIESAKNLNCEYMVVLVPLNFDEGRDFPLTPKGKGHVGIDRIQFVVRLLEVSSGLQIDQIEVQGQSGFLTFWGDAPIDLVDAALNQLAGNLAG